MVVAKTKTFSSEQQAELYEIGNLIREARENAKMTQNNLADLLECDRATISHYEGGAGGYIGGARLYRLCDVLHLTPNDLSPTRFRKKEGDTEEQVTKLEHCVSTAKKKVFNEKMRSLLRTYEIPKVSALPPEKYETFLNDVAQITM